MKILPPIIGTNHLLWQFVRGVNLYSEVILNINGDYSQLSLNGHLYKADTSLK